MMPGKTQTITYNQVAWVMTINIQQILEKRKPGGERREENIFEVFVTLILNKSKFCF